jgi:hypothetical protein
MRYATEKQRSICGPRRCLAFLAAVALVLVVATDARAEGRFVYESCDPALPGGNPPTTVFRYTEGTEFGAIQNCAVPSGSIGVGQMSTTVTGWLAILEDPILSTPGGWVESVTVTGSSGRFHRNEGHIYMKGRSEEPQWPVPDVGDDTRYFLLRAQPPSVLESPLEREDVLGFMLLCDLFTRCEPGAFVTGHFIAAVEVDPVPPVVDSVEGPLVAGSVLRGDQTLRAQASDVGGGVRSLELRVNGVVMPGTAIGACSIASVSNPSYRGVVATSPIPCPPSLSGTWNVDTSAAPFQNGPNTVQVCASDLSTKGAANIGCSASQTVQVDNSCTESPVAGGSGLEAAFSKDGSDDLTVGFGNPTEVTGELTDPGGGPVSGATICLESRPEGSTAPTQTVGTVKTDSQGNFSMEIAPGSNRILMVGYRHGSFQIEKKLSLATRAHPTVKLSTHKIRGGRKVEITGSLPKPNPGGRVLVLQGSGEHGKVWLTFKKVTTAPDGTYRTTYTFAKPRRSTGFRIRVEAPAQAGYEYEPGASNPARIKVRP